MVGMLQQVGFALGVRDDLGRGMPHLELELLFREGLVNDACALPDHLASGLLFEPGAEVAVWTEQDGLIFWNGVDHVDGVGARADHIGEAFTAAVQLMTTPVPPGWSAFHFDSPWGLRLPVAAGQVEHDALEDFCGLRHEVHTTEQNHIRIGVQLPWRQRLSPMSAMSWMSGSW